MERSVDLTYEVGQLITFPDGTFGFVLANDLQKRQIMIKIVDSQDEGFELAHSYSLQSLPDWHKEFCEYCRTRIEIET